MRITVNGSEREVPAVRSAAELLAWLSVRGEAVAVEINLRVVPRKDLAATPVNEGDRLEIVGFVGGG